MQLQVKYAGVLCEGAPAPGLNHNAAFPNLLRCPDGSLLASHRVGTRKDSADGIQWLWRSHDDGATWSRLANPIARKSDHPRREHRVVALSDIGRGTIAMLLTWIDHLDDTSPLSNAATEGLMPIHISWTTSTDNGDHWTPLREIDVSPLIQPAGNGPILRMPNGDLLLALETYKTWDDPSPWSAHAAIARSSDDGRTWTTTIIASDPSHRLSYFDQYIHPLRDGTLLNVMWVDDRRKPGDSEIYQTHSRDGGYVWSAPAPTGIRGQFCTLVDLPDGRPVMFYVSRHNDSAIRMAIASPDGGEWQTHDDWILYSHRSNDLAGVQGKDFGDYMQHMSKWTFGWPSAVARRDGSLLVAYYAGNGDRTSVHVANVAIAASNRHPQRT